MNDGIHIHLPSEMTAGEVKDVLTASRSGRESEAYDAGRLAGFEDGFQEGFQEGDGLRAVVQEWADLCNDYDLNERGQAVMIRLRALLAASYR